MSKIIQSVHWDNSKFDNIIDVRTPSEFKEDHIIGSLNYPVLSDYERELVGTIYKKDSPFQARIIGSSIISRNISKLITKKFSKKPGSWRPLVYCWRGGQRSRALCVVMNEIGWRSTQLLGGYKYYRHNVIKQIEKMSSKLKVILISGKTGTGKTKLLHEISKIGGQIIDLEKIANHKGSLLGKNLKKPQPSQKLFESQLFNCLCNLNFRKKVFIEAESSKIGNLHIPKALWNKMLLAKKINIDAPLDSRINFLINDYKYVQFDENFFDPFLNGLKNRINNNIMTEIKHYIKEKNWELLTKSLLENHYDPSYTLNYNKKNHQILKNYNLNKVSKKHLNLLAHKIL